MTEDFNLTLYERLFGWIESGQPCPAQLREALTRAFDGYFSGQAEHLEHAFGIAAKPGAQRGAYHRKMVMGAQIYRRVLELHEGPQREALNKAGAFGTAAAEFGVSASTVENYFKFHREMKPHPKND